MRRGPKGETRFEALEEHASDRLAADSYAGRTIFHRRVMLWDLHRLVVGFRRNSKIVPLARHSLLLAHSVTDLRCLPSKNRHENLPPDLFTSVTKPLALTDGPQS